MASRLSPLAGQPAPADSLIDVDALSPPTAPSAPTRRSPRERVAFGTSGHRGSSFERVVQRMARAGDHARRSATTARSRASTARSSSASTPTRCRQPACGQRARGAGRQRRRGDDRQRRRIHADAGGLACHPHLQPRPHQRAGRRHRDHALAQPAATTAASSTTRPTAARPAPTSRAGSRSGQRLLETASRACAGCRYAQGPAAPRPRTATTSWAPTWATWAASSTWTRSATRTCAWASIRSAAPGCTTGRRIAERYRLDLTVVSDDGRPDLPLHDRSTGTARSAWTRRRPTRCSACSA